MAQTTSQQLEAISKFFNPLDWKLFAVGAVKCAGVIGFIVKRKDVRLSFFRVG
jgi:hypothetical protein